MPPVEGGVPPLEPPVAVVPPVPLEPVPAWLQANVVAQTVSAYEHHVADLRLRLPIRVVRSRKFIRLFPKGAQSLSHYSGDARIRRPPPASSWEVREATYRERVYTSS